MRYSRFALSLVWVFSLAACSLPSPEKRDGNDGGALFYVDKVDGKSVRTQVDPQTSILVSQTVAVLACVKDYKLQKPIQNHRYQILRKDEIVEELTTNAEGCIEWQETVALDSISKSVIEMNRTLRGIGVYGGEQRVRFYVNTEDGSVKSGQSTSIPGAIDEDKSAGPQATEAAQARLWIEDLRLAVEEKNNIGGTLFNFKVRTLAQIERKKLNGETILETLNFGQFKVHGRLLHIYPLNGKEVRRPLSSRVSVDSQVVKGSMYFDLPIKLDLICTKGQIQIALEVEPTTPGISRFEGVFIVADCDAIKGNFFSRLENQAAVKNQTFSIANYLTDTGLPSKEELQDFYQLARIEIKRLTFNDVGFVGQKALNRERKFQVGACLKTGLDQKAAKAQTLKITRIDGSKVDVRTNDDGCAYWDDSIRFQYLDNECWKDYSVTIENANLDVKETIALSINPWANNESFARDKRFIDTGSKAPTCAAGESEFIIQSYSFDKKTYQIKMDEFMNIRLDKTGNFQLNFGIKRPSLTEPTGYAVEQAPPGDYLLRLGVLDISADSLTDVKGKIYHVSEHIVKSQGAGIIVQDLMLSTANIRAIGNTNTLVVQLLPLSQEKAELAKQGKEDLITFVDPAFRNRSMIFKGPVMIGNNKEGNALEPVQLQPGRDFMTQLIVQKNYDDTKYKDLMSRLSRKETLQKDQNLQLINLTDSKKVADLINALNSPVGLNADKQTKKLVKNLPAIEFSDLQLLLNGTSLSPTLAKRLCLAWSHEFYARTQLRTGRGALRTDAKAAHALASSCLNTIETYGPKQFFNVEFRHLVKNPTLKSVDQTLVKDVTIASGFAMNRTFTESFAKSVGMDISLGLKIPGLSVLNAGTGARAQVTKTWAHSENHAATNSFASGIALFLENIRLSIAVESSEKCAVIRLQPNLFAGGSWMQTIFDASLTAEEKGSLAYQGLLICDGVQRPRRGVLRENIYVLNQKTMSGQVVDTNADLGRPFFTVIRGTNDLHAFMSYLHATYDVPRQADPREQTVESSNQRLERAFLKANPTYPGHYIIGY